MRLTLKRLAEHIPEPIGRVTSLVPFSWRLGQRYKLAQAEISRYKLLSNSERGQYIFQRFKRIVEFAVHNNPFYRDFYRERRFYTDALRSFDDIKRVPIVNKLQLLEYDIEFRSTPQAGRMLVNTGGTSGTPLAFYLNAHAFAIEWAHMHTIWARVDYRQTDLKLTFRGKNLGNELLRYNAVHNEFYVNAYADLELVSAAVLELAQRRRISYLHGYPSAIYNFALHCVAKYPNLIELLRRDLKGVLFGSEFPAPQYRDLVENTFLVPSVSWYGHSEMAVLAFEEAEKYVYVPMHTYGYCEAETLDNGCHLVGTSFENTVSPFIRYDTGDIISPAVHGQILNQFRIEKGRVGDFILDRTGQRISLTALIFGRHHDLFSKVKFLQVRQERPGQATILVTLAPGVPLSSIDWSRDFDGTNVDIVFDFQALPQPIMTTSGKIPLLVKSNNLE